ncbi:hypothetical protein [Cryobacterium luteum]|uniref:Uncharacterized protein n=1 Tax=Cryobacterium luteum TaxID=1424661 RepID=A0A5F0D415_9MICO|nr:hypothetical protein [Cryobacterium luteum]TFB88628.1 hypothetical protein E3O10_12680 [Cryobacterium luteum]
MNRTVTWGDALVVAAFHSPGGLKSAVTAIAREVGPHIGNRNTFAKLLRVTSPTDLSEKDRWRAWLLLAAFGEDPRDWGILDQVVPTSIDRPALLERLTVRPKGFEPPTF